LSPKELLADKLLWLELPGAKKFLLTIVVTTTILPFMVSKLQTELKQNKPFGSIEEEVLLNLARTAEVVSSALAIVLKQADLTGTQYNALRILRGAGSDGLSCGEVSDRMVTKDSDITRLLDRLESRELISRERPANNRRTVIARITVEGLRILEELDEPVSQSNRRLAGHLGKERLKTLNTLLEDLRSKLT
jgi:DNA-binding MarR family transcriptional regulator